MFPSYFSLQIIKIRSQKQRKTLFDFSLQKYGARI